MQGLYACYRESPETDLENINKTKADLQSKMLIEGQLYILHQGTYYDALGRKAIR